MTTLNYAIINYGIAIPIDNSELYQYVLERLISKNQDLYETICKKNIDDFLVELSLQPYRDIDVSFDVEGIEFINLDKDYKSIYVDNILILVGDHETPTLYSTPFKSKEDCIEHYKQKFKNILPKNFDYKNNIGEISYVI